MYKFDVYTVGSVCEDKTMVNGRLGQLIRVGVAAHVQYREF